MEGIARQITTLDFGESGLMWCLGLAGLVLGSLLVLTGLALAISRAPRSRGILVALGGAGSTIGGINLLFLSTGREPTTLGRLVIVGALLLIIVSVLVVGLVTLVEHQRSSRR